MEGPLPDLGRRGEGWFLAQCVLLAAVLVTGVLGPAWAGVVRVVATAAGLPLCVFGAVLIVGGALALGENLTVFPKPRPGADLIDTGVYGLVRHPIYGGLILGSVGWALLLASFASLACAGILGLVLLLKSAREEAWLTEQFDGYPAYRARTRRLIPFVF